jgi:hypothetical protein
MIVERCYCCYEEDSDGLENFQSTDKESYKEITGFDIKDENNKICEKCKTKLSDALDFLRLCKTSRDKLLEERIIISEISEEHIIFEDEYEEIDNEDKEEEVKKYSCDVCNMKFRQRNALKCHERVHTKVRHQYLQRLNFKYFNFRKNLTCVATAIRPSLKIQHLKHTFQRSILENR